MIAAAAAAAASKNATFVLTRNSCNFTEDIKNLFEFSIPFLPASAMKGWRVVPQKTLTDYTKIPSTAKNITITGFRQNWKYFTGVKEKEAVKRVFRLNDKFKEFTDEVLSAFKQRSPAADDAITVGVHMRLGDLQRPRAIKYGYQIAKKEFYAAAMKAAVAKLGGDSTRLVFFIGSDSKATARAMISSLKSTYTMVWLKGQAYADFAVLSQCDHHIISGGTFGFWTAWLSEGVTFYHKQFAKPKSNYSKVFKNENFYLPHWIPI